MNIPKSVQDELAYWIKGGKYGHLKINFMSGRIMNMTRVESVKVDPIGYIVPTQSFSNVSETDNVPKDDKLE